MKLLGTLIGFLLILAILAFPAYMGSSFGFVTGWISNIAVIFVMYFLSSEI